MGKALDISSPGLLIMGVLKRKNGRNEDSFAPLFLLYLQYEKIIKIVINFNGLYKIPNMSKIAYLFGAGASEGALPLVKEMPERIESLMQTISSDDLALSNKVFFEGQRSIQFQTKREHQKDLIKGLEWLHDASSKHINVDTFAKKLYVRKDFDSLDKLKILLSVFFTLEQTRRPPNPRYDFFYASIINSISDFPNDVRILSWNYDFQFEIAFSEFSNEKDLGRNQKTLNIHTKTIPIVKKDIETFGIYKLNGSAELHESRISNPRSHFYNLDISPTLDLKILEATVRMYATATNTTNLIPSFSFAWEDSYFKSFDDAIMEDTKDTRILVVIGYSFPYFNRTIDKGIISEMKNLSKVYFQSPEAKELIERFKSIRNDLTSDKLIPISDLRYFYIPDELS